MLQKTVLSIVFFACLFFSAPVKAGGPDSKPKYATVNVYFRGMAPAKIFVIKDGKIESIKCDGGFADTENGELGIFGPVQEQLEKLGEIGFQLQSTASLSPSLLVYTLVKD